MVNPVVSNSTSLLDFVAQRAAERKAAAGDSGADSASAQGEGKPSLQDLIATNVPQDLKDAVARTVGFTEQEGASGDGMSRREKLWRLDYLERQNEMINRMAEDRKKVIDFIQKQAASPTEDAQSVTGAEAAAVWELARQDARNGGHFSFPPPRNGNLIFMNDGYQYNIRGDGTITKQKEGVLTPEQQASTVKELDHLASQYEIAKISDARTISGNSKEISAIKNELGISDDSWRSEASGSPNMISVTA